MADEPTSRRVPPRREGETKAHAPSTDPFIDPDATVVVHRERAFPDVRPPGRAAADDDADLTVVAPAGGEPAARSVRGTPRVPERPRMGWLPVGVGVVVAALVVGIAWLVPRIRFPRDAAPPQTQVAPPVEVASEPPPAAPAWQRTAPAAEQQTVAVGETLVFEAEAVQTPGATVVPVWALDGREVGRGGVLRFVATAADAAAERELVAEVTSPSGRIERRWRIAVRPANQPPGVAARVPAAGTVTLLVGDRQRFAVTASDADGAPGTPLTYSWEQDDQPVASGPDAGWTLEATTPAETRVRVLVTDAAGAAAEPVVWRVIVRPRPNLPPEVLAQVPPGDRPLRVAEGDSVDLRLRARDPNPGDQLSYRWLLDGREAGTQASFRFTAAAPLGTNHVIQGEVTDRSGAKAAPARWTVEATPKLRHVEALDWVERLRVTWERKDVSTLRLYGVIAGEPQAATTRRTLARYDGYKVLFSDVTARVEGPNATVSFNRTDTAGGKVVSSTRQTYELEKHPTGLVTLRGGSWR